ncbi:cellulose binding domain-containing protein [Streptomyces europaeiscabiei]|uniref:cellulose binding domain-containing protein n=1 Tax=Streptomyces europaeiscabiei TaxID=146819 RepID=UPI0038D400CB
MSSRTVAATHGLRPRSRRGYGPVDGRRRGGGDELGEPRCPTIASRPSGRRSTKATAPVAAETITAPTSRAAPADGPDQAIRKADPGRLTVPRATVHGRCAPDIGLERIPLPSSGQVTASGLTYNASISPGGSQTVGFQGSCSGVFAAPGGRAGRSGLTGTVCTVS